MTEFEAIYKEYFRDVYLYIRGLAGNEHIAEEIAEETFFKALKALNEFRGECDIRVWLCQIAKNEYFQYLRKNKRLETTDFSERMDGEDEAASGRRLAKQESPSIEQQIVDSETAVRIHKLLHNLPEPYKEVFQLRVFGELSFGQIGEIFEKSANWACVTYHRARAKIQEEMEEKS